MAFVSRDKVKRPDHWRPANKHGGAIAEFIACEWFARQGYEVFRNMSQHGIADFVVWVPGNNPILYDVKSITRSACGRYLISSKASDEQIKAGVKILYVNRDTRQVSENLDDFKEVDNSYDEEEFQRLIEKFKSVCRPPSVGDVWKPLSGKTVPRTVLGVQKGKVFYSTPSASSLSVSYPGWVTWIRVKGAQLRETAGATGLTRP